MRGFVTLAVGEEKYYQLASNLLKSYRYHTKNPLPFAIVADRKNHYTDLFDSAVILENATGSYLDKIELLRIAPFQESIFLDADCLAYRDLNTLWVDFPAEGGVACYGKALPLNSKDGWFLKEDIGEYQEQIDFIPQMHGGIIFIRRDELTRAIYEQALLVTENYAQYRFKYFSKPADEPILALSMAIYGCRPIERKKGTAPAYLFYPVAKKVKQDIRKGCLSFSIDGENWIHDVAVLHWQNVFTNKPEYRIAVDSLELGKGVICDYCFVLKWILYYAFDWNERVFLRMIRRIRRQIGYWKHDKRILSK